MKVIAKENGFFGKYIQKGEEFDVPDGLKATWFEPVEEEQKPPKQAKPPKEQKPVEEEQK